MCGINGFIRTDKPEVQKVETTLAEMNEWIFHRGPDEDGLYIHEDSNYTVGMGMRRLSIIDLSTGKQPIFSADKMLIIVFNGEIYNYKILKESLIVQGVLFETNSDTEVILKLYERHGIEAFSMLDGMFAVSIFDRRINKVIIARDFFGEKPLYYTNIGKQFYWASELKSILKVLPLKPEIDINGFNLYFQLTYIPAPYTIYKDVYKLQANHCLVYDCNTSDFDITEIKQIANEFEKPRSFLDACKTTRELLNESVQSRMISDVPLGTFLSGGVDSSIISLIASQHLEKRIDTFSIGFDKAAFDESEKSRLVAKLINSNHHEFIIGEQDLTRNIDKILLNFDEPFADSSALASYLVAEKTRAHVKVALTGDGGDEVFGGYNKYYMGKLNSRYTKLIPKPVHISLEKLLNPILSMKHDQRGMRFKLKRLLNAIDYNADFYYNIISLGFSSGEMDTFVNKKFIRNNCLEYYKSRIEENSTISDFRNIDRYLSLEGDMLVKVDRTSMLTSLECRAPFLNKKLWDFTAQLPESYLINGWDKKHILKKSFENSFPKGFLNKGKKGFGVPVGDWLRQGLMKELISYIDRDFIDKQGLFVGSSIENLVLDHINGIKDNTFRVWTYYCFQKWYRNIYDK